MISFFPLFIFCIVGGGRARKILFTKFSSKQKTVEICISMGNWYPYGRKSAALKDKKLKKKEEEKAEKLQIKIA